MTYSNAQLKNIYNNRRMSSLCWENFASAMDAEFPRLIEAAEKCEKFETLFHSERDTVIAAQGELAEQIKKCERLEKVLCQIQKTPPPQIQGHFFHVSNEQEYQKIAREALEGKE